MIDGSTRAVAVARAGSVPSSPVYQLTVFAAVPATSAVAVSKGGPATRCGGWVASMLKKSLAAATADAAESEVAASLPTEAVNAVCRFVAVTSLVAPMVNSFGPGVAEVVAVSVMLSLEPSGSVKRYWMVSPAAGLAAPRSSGQRRRGAARPVTVAPVRVEFTPASLKPNGETASSGERSPLVAARRRDHQAAETVGAEIGLIALGDDLLETGAPRRRS